MLFAATSLDNSDAREAAIETLARFIGSPIVFLRSIVLRMAGSKRRMNGAFSPRSGRNC
jgi:hypothetical protein